MRRIVAGLLALGWALATVTVASVQTSTCTFVLGFAELHNRLPNVGACVDNEQHNPTNGDALQRTTGGLLVWRKADNWTAFTDGSQSWVNGPLGLQQRFNSQRFWWEANPDRLEIVPAPVAGDRCHTAGLTLSFDGADAGAGNFVGTFHFTNVSSVTCTMFGYPGAELLNGTGDPLPTVVERAGGYFRNLPPPSTVVVAPGGQAQFRVHWEQVPVGNETTCPLASSLAVTPPDEYVSLPVATQIRACGGGHLNVSAIQIPGNPF